MTVSLVCGCCGDLFRTRPGYKDQDQDVGYGICKPCQIEAKKHNKKLYDEAFQQIYNALNDDNKKKVDADILKHGPKRKTVLVNIGLEKGWFSWSIGGK